MSRYSYWGFKPQPTVWERQHKAAKTIARMRKKGADLDDVFGIEVDFPHARNRTS